MDRSPTATPELNAAEPDCNGRRAFDEARARCPMVALTIEQFAAHLSRVGCHDAAAIDPQAMYLCAACSLGSEPACEYFVRAYFPPLKKLLFDRFEAADFVGQVLDALRERLFAPPARQIATYQGNGSVHAWLRGIAIRLASDRLREEMGPTWTVVDELHGSDTSHPAALVAPAFGQRLTEAALLFAIGALEPADKQLLHLRHVLGLRPEQIARCLGVCHTTVYRRIHHAEGRVRRAADSLGKLSVEGRRGLFPSASWQVTS